VEIADVRTLKLQIQDADPAYVAMKLGEGDGGAALYAHLRAVPSITDFRREAIRRAERLYDERLAARGSDDEISGLGLLVLQRAMFAVEDLGGLLHAFTEPASWSGLVSYNLDGLTASFDALFAGGDKAIARAYLLPPDDALENEPGLTAEQREAVRALRNEALRQTRERLERVAELWRMLHRHAKKTVHGLGFLAGTMVIEPPGAGRISELLGDQQERPFVISLETTVNDENGYVNTELQAIVVDRNNIGVFVDAGLAACDASDFLASGRLHGLQTNHAFTLPKGVIDELPAETAAVLRELFNDE
jgi:hypothetical protein